jgi:cytochrome b involved in lipid metabolism
MPSNESDCWMGLCGVVYDLSVYTPVHPGGSLLVAVYCGENATDILSTNSTPSHDE